MLGWKGILAVISVLVLLTLGWNIYLKITDELPGRRPVATVSDPTSLVRPDESMSDLSKRPAPLSEAISKVDPKTTFTFRVLGDPETLDWNRAHTAIETHLLNSLMEGLLAHDTQMNLVPALAESWSKSPDGKTYRFSLRKGVRWSDGVELKAKDFLDSWKRVLSPLTSAPYAYLFFEVVGAQDYNKGLIHDFNRVGFRKIDDYTLEIQLVRPVAHFSRIPTFWTTYPIRADVIEKYGSAWTKPGNMVTVGPYVLESYELDSKIVMRKNPYYYGTRGNVETAVGLIIKDDSAAMNLYETNRLDVLTDLSAIDLRKLTGRKDLKVFPYLKTGYLGLTQSKYPANNVHFRRAIAMAIDKTKIGEILHGGQKPASSFLPPGLLGYDANLGLKFNPAAAKKELELSGIMKNLQDPVEFLTINFEKNLYLSNYIQNQLKINLGLPITIQQFENKTFRAQLELFQFPLFLGSWSADFPDSDSFLSVFLSTSGNNRVNWKNSDYDQKVLLGRSAQAAPARTQYYLEAQRIMLEKDVALIPLFYEPIMALVKSHVNGFEIDSINTLKIKNVRLSDNHSN